MVRHAKLGHAAICGEDDPELWMPRGSAYQLMVEKALPPDFCSNCEQELPKNPPTPGEPEFIDP